MKATGTYKVTKWDEQTLQDLSPGTKTTRASVVYTITGEIDGTARVEYLMFYRHFDEKSLPARKGCV